MNLVGEYERSLDGNGRLALPSNFATEFGRSAILTDDPQGCVRISVERRFDERAEDILERFRRGEISRDDIRAESSDSRRIKVDAQGRLTIDEKARHLANIAPGSDVVLVGVMDSIEIWKRSRHEVIQREKLRHTPRRVWDDEE